MSELLGKWKYLLNHHYDDWEDFKVGNIQDLVRELQSLQSNLDIANSGLNHLWHWLPIRYREDYLKDYPTQRKSIDAALEKING